MKKLWPSVACSAVLLSGCMYGSATAPITALNGSSNQFQPSNQYQPSRAPVGQIQVNQGQAVALTPTRVPPPRTTPGLPQPQPAQVVPAQPQQGMVVDAASPYGQPPVMQPTRPQTANTGSDDGWAVAPQPNQAQQAPTNAQAVNAGSNQPQNTSQAQPVRPPAESQQSSNSAANTTASTDSASNAASSNQNEAQNQQVASATPPQQPATPAKEETAVSTLLKKASASLGKGDLDGAAAYLENAQRIEPQNAKILYDIANIRYHQGRYKDAETFAGRAVQVGGGNAMMKKSWALVANARKSLGDNQGAIAAAERAASFGN